MHCSHACIFFLGGGGKVHPNTELYSFLIMALEGVRGQRHAPATLYLWGRPSTHCTGGWVGPRASLDRCGKSQTAPPGFDPRTVQPIASHYTN